MSGGKRDYGQFPKLRSLRYEVIIWLGRRNIWPHKDTTDEGRRNVVSSVGWELLTNIIVLYSRASIAFFTSLLTGVSYSWSGRKIRRRQSILLWKLPKQTECYKENSTPEPSLHSELAADAFCVWQVSVTRVTSQWYDDSHEAFGSSIYFSW